MKIFHQRWQSPVLFFCAVCMLLILSCRKNESRVSTLSKSFDNRTASTAPLESGSAARSTLLACDTCEVTGMYVGTSYPNGGGGSSNSIYEFFDNNFVVGHHETYEPGVSFGGYTTNCYSIIWNVNYIYSGNYYLLKGVFSNGRNTISGTFQNLGVPSDYGTFTMSK